MEIFLLRLLDEIDDAAAIARLFLPRVLGFLLACGAFALSIATAIRWPHLALVGLLLAILAVALRWWPLLRIKSNRRSADALTN